MRFFVSPVNAKFGKIRVCSITDDYSQDEVEAGQHILDILEDIRYNGEWNSERAFVYRLTPCGCVDYNHYTIIPIVN